jgi:hypothetical protein
MRLEKSGLACRTHPSSLNGVHFNVQIDIYLIFVFFEVFNQQRIRVI